MEKALTELKSGETGVILRLEGGEAFERKLAALNIRAGKTVKKVTAQPFSGPVVIEIDNTEVTLGRKMAERIFVAVPGERA
jgi:ferrous iron transport protein A